MITRVRVIGGPWPQRIGCTGVIVEAPPGYHGYPWAGRAKNEVIVLLDNDPLGCDKRGCDHNNPEWFMVCNHHDLPWTCAIGRDDVAPIAP